MHAIIHSMKIHDVAGARELVADRLSNDVVPRVSKMPGFVRGTFLSDADAGTSVAVVVFETRDAAERVAAHLRDPHHVHDEAVTTGVDIYEVAAEA